MVSQNDFFHGFGGPKHGKNTKNGCFWTKNNIQNAVGGGMHAWKNFILEIRLVRYLEVPFAKS